MTDQAGKARKSITDAAGRLAQLIEDPNGAAYQTTYTYDVLDDLTVVQQGVQTRTFTYDTLKRLTSATNPESNTITYDYDANGNVHTKTDARGITTTFHYDGLNRVYQKSYSDATPGVTYSYDTGTNGKGHLTQVVSTVSTTNYGPFDAMGRVTASSQVTDTQTYTFSYGYNLAGGMTSETYPSQRTVTTSYDAAGRINGVTGSGNKTYASSFTYSPHGAVQTMTLGNNLTETRQFNSRLQPTSIGLGSLATFAYTYGTTNNNGNVLTHQIILPGLNVTQGYCYDRLNRLTGIYEPVVPGQCQTSGWSQTYDYDQYGNRTNVQSPPYLSNPPTLVPAPAIDSSTNRFQAGTGFGYDNAGNLTQAPAGVRYTYDAENRLINFPSGTATYAYDGDGQRVKKVVGLTTMTYVYNVAGRLVAEYGNEGASGPGGTKYLTADHLGSTRLVTDASGSVISRHDYLPFGEAVSTGISGRTAAMGYEQADGINQKFTGKERDLESGLDDFGARYTSSSLGRFLSVDPTRVSVSVIDPQSWNRYSYALNNPLVYTDPNGKWSTRDHEEIIDAAFRNILSPQDRDDLKHASYLMDTWEGSVHESFKHGMSEEGEDPFIASQRAGEFVSNRLDAAVKAYLIYEDTGDPVYRRMSLYDFGDALHTVTDVQTPQHQGYQVWRGVEGHLSSALSHGIREWASGRLSDLNIPSSEEAKHNATVQATILWSNFQRRLRVEKERRNAEACKNGDASPCTDAKKKANEAPKRKL